MDEKVALDFKVCECGEKEVHGYFHADNNPFPIPTPPVKSKEMGRFLVELLEEDGSKLENGTAEKLRNQIENSGMDEEATEDEKEFIDSMS